MPTHPTRRQQQKEDTRRLILATACRSFCQSGYERTTMRTIAGQAGIGLGTIFKHFPDKPSLLVAAYKEDLGAVITETLSALPRAGLLDQLSRLTAGIYGWYAANPLFSRALVKEALFLDGGHGDALDQQLEAFLAAVAALIVQAVAAGELPGETDAALGARAFGAFYLGELIIGLKQPAFDVAGRTREVAALCAAYFRLPAGPDRRERER